MMHLFEEAAVISPCKKRKVEEEEEREVEFPISAVRGTSVRVAQIFSHGHNSPVRSVSLTELVQLGEGSHKYVHVGTGEFNQQPYVYVRLFVRSDIEEGKLIPLKGGAGLTVSEWSNLCQLADVINTQVVKLQSPEYRGEKRPTTSTPNN